MRRKILAGLLAGVMVLGTLTACGGGGEEASSSGGDSGEAAATEEGGEASAEGSSDLGTVTLILSNRDEFLSTLEVGVQNAAADMGVEMVNSGRAERYQQTAAVRGDAKKTTARKRSSSIRWIRLPVHRSSTRPAI